jgi:CMP/dCMP kinase
MIQIKMSIIIAIDGHSSCGKSSFAKSIASELNYLYIDSGAMYRAVTLFAMRNGLITNGKVDVEGLEKRLLDVDIDFKKNQIGAYETYMNGENIENDIRTMQVSENVSEVSKIKTVRSRLVALQQKMGTRKEIVMDGRDIGTVVFPDAELKLFMTASLDIRAQRRYKELAEKGTEVSLSDVRDNLAQRDYLDENRTESPLIKANDAIILDNSDLTPPQQMEWFKKILGKFQ